MVAVIYASNRFCSTLLILLTCAVYLPALPAHADPDMAPAFAPNRAALASSTREITQLPGGLMLVVPHKDSSTDNNAVVQDSHYGWSFEGRLWLYAPQGAESDRPAGLRRILTVYHQGEDAALALRVARLCARLYHLQHTHWDRTPVFGQGREEASVWLAASSPPSEKSEKGQATDFGGETRDNQLYIFDVHTPRTTLEWTRTVAHEWGHLTILAARGFTAPENDAAGFLGERLFIKWLREDTAKAVASFGDDGVTRADLDTYNRRQVAPLLTRYAQLGDNRVLLGRRDAPAMDLYIGGVLSADEKYGAKLAGEALYTVEGTAPEDFFAALRRARPERKQ